MDADRIDRSSLYAIGTMGLLAAEAGLGVIDLGRETLLPLAGLPLGLPPSPDGYPLDLSPSDSGSYLSEETVHRILRASRGALPAQLQVKVGLNLYALYLTSLPRGEAQAVLARVLGEGDPESAVFFVAFPIKNIDSFMLRPEDAGLLAMPLLESFHELARPIGIASMFLSKLRLDRAFSAEMEAARPETWQELCFIETMISGHLYPMIKHLGLVEKYGQLGAGAYATQGYPLGAALEQTIGAFLKSLELVRATASFGDFGIPPEVFARYQRMCEFDVPEKDALVEIPRPLLDTIATELTLNALKNLPRGAEYDSSPRTRSPIRIRISNTSQETFCLSFRNIHKAKPHVDNLRKFKHTVMSRPLGGLAGVNRLIRSVGWSLDFNLHPATGGDSLHYFDLTINGYRVRELRSNHE